MKLSELLRGHRHEVLSGDAETEITGVITSDSRSVERGSVFVAISGTSLDGHDFVNQAVQAGAVAVVASRAMPTLPKGVCLVTVSDTQTVVATMASRFYGMPSRQLKLVAITGTNGKTTVAFLLEWALRQAASLRVGVIGTEGIRIGEEPTPLKKTTPTTPEAIDLQCALRYMVDHGAALAVMEASSVALVQGRVDECDIDIGIFTNLSQDHLDYHGSMDAYRDAKLRLFDNKCRTSVVNADDPVSAAILAWMPAAVTFGLANPTAHWRASDIYMDTSGSRFTLLFGDRTWPVCLPLPGRFNISNALATIATCHMLGLDVEEVIKALGTIPQLPGRFQTIATGNGVGIVIDYAHSEDSLIKVLDSIAEFSPSRIIAVFGAGGDRDRTKRAPMGRSVGERADISVLTLDNPRTEDPDTILNDVEAGLKTVSTEYVRIEDRRAAIRHALKEARPGDVILVAGKGSENYQIFADRTIHFSDLETVQELLKEMSH
jgi:UDP-N-acetylmuramoyl-L-alanyl-D-glutamate--2,6-diaminopimelate ligase